MGLARFLIRSRFAHAVQRWTGEDLCSVCNMSFVIRFEGGKLPSFSFGPPGRELACYVPDGFDWRQIRFGQREGAAEIDGREWGFYFSGGEGELTVLLESGDVAPATAEAFVRRVAAKLAGREAGFQIYLRGERACLGNGSNRILRHEEEESRRSGRVLAD